MATRLKNTAQFNDYVKAVKSSLSKWTYDYINVDQAEVAGRYFDFLEELLSKTPRPGKELLLQAVKKVHAKVDVQEIACFVDRILSVCLYLRMAARASTSCKNLSAKIRPLVQLLKKHSSSDLSPSPEADRTRGTSSGSTSSTTAKTMTKASIFESYGLQMPSYSKASCVVEVEEIEDSPVAVPAKCLEWFDSVSNTYKRKLRTINL